MKRTDHSGGALLLQIHIKKYSTATIASLTIWLMLCSSSSTLALDMLEETKFKKSGAQSAVVRACATQARHCDMLRTAPSHSLQEGADAKKKRVTRTAQSSCNCEGGTLVHA